jgi:hypothetical protein
MVADGSFDDTVARIMQRHGDTMNQAILITSERGPAAAMEFIADYLSNTDAVDEEMADALPDDWLTRWVVGRHAE